MGIILEVQGVLNQVLPGVFRERLPVILANYRNMPVRLMITTQLDRIDDERRREGNYYLPARDGQPVAFTWKAAGAFHAVIRRFRLDFLRHLSPVDLRSPIYLAIWLGEDATAYLTEEIARTAQLPASRPAAQPVRDSLLGEDTGAELRISAPDQVVRNPLRAPRIAASKAAMAQPAPQPAPPRPAAQVIEAIHSAPAPLADPAETAHPEPQHEPQPATAAPQPNPTSSAPPTPRPVVRPARTAAALPGNFYQDWFGFEHMPFNNTPDPRFFLPTEKHQEALSRLIYAISERKGFVMISGEIGSGKSTLCRTLLAQLPNEVKTALITHTHIDPEQLVRAIAEDLDLPVAGKSKYEILQTINHFLVEQLAAGCTVCIIIDEAQNLSPAALEEVRMISNLETEEEKLVQLILLGQPELRDKIRLPEMLQLRQRIAVQYHLEPLTRSETLDYIQHRIRVAGPTEPLQFRKRAMIEVFNYSRGVPRLINTLCDNALLTAYTRETREITPDIIREAARDLDLEDQNPGLAGLFRFW